jgi:protein-S-isoprenylcysteine O-methyltransferase Ste14
MSSTASTIEESPSPPAGAIRERAGARWLAENLLPAAVWGLMVYLQVIRYGFPPALPNLLSVLINTLLVGLFLFRRQARAGASLREMTVALSGTFLVSFIPEAEHTSLVSTAVQVAGLVMWLAALAGLGRSIGIAPADRGLKMGGPYALVRHPVYASEFVFYFGLLLAVANLTALAVFLVWWALQVCRMLLEERAIQGYADYMKRVRWRVLPGVW